MSGSVEVSILGATGSIGTQTLEVIDAEPDRYKVVALGANSSVELLLAQVEKYRPQLVVVTDPDAASGVANRLPAGTDLLVGPSGLAEAARIGDVVINGVVGFAGLEVTLAALKAGKRLGLANKESLIAAGPVVKAAWATPGAELIPVDSEHAAVHQCLRANDNPERLARIVLTASGGPFRGRKRADLVDVTVDEALAHPTWSMGPKISVDSSTLMNKGLEVIEAHELFGASYDQIEVVVHPQSIVHSMVEFSDGSTIAQLSQPDMRLPIGYALAWPDRLSTPFGRIDWTSVPLLEFGAPDLDAFPCLGLAYDAGRVGETAPAWLNAANEIAVAAFLNGDLKWIDIPEVCKGVLDRHDGATADSVEAVIEADRRARETARQLIERRL